MGKFRVSGSVPCKGYKRKRLSDGSNYIQPFDSRKYRYKNMFFKNKKSGKPKTSKKRTKGGKVPQGRTLSTYDHYLGNGKKTGSKKERPVVVIETNDYNDLAVVPLSSRKGNDRTKLKRYQQGQSYFKHYVEIQDDEGNPIRVNKKFRENHPNMDVSNYDIEKIKDKVFNHCKASSANREKIKKFRKK